MYSKKIVALATNPSNAGALDTSRTDVGTGVKTHPECGDVIRLQIQVCKDRIVDAKFKTFGSPPAIAAGAFAADWVKGKSVEEASSLDDRYIARKLDLPEGKKHCSVLAQGAVCEAIEDWKKKSS